MCVALDIPLRASPKRIDISLSGDKAGFQPAKPQFPTFAESAHFSSFFRKIHSPHSVVAAMKPSPQKGMWIISAVLL